MFRLHHLSLGALASVLAISATACGLPSSLDDIFGEPSGGAAQGGGGASSTGAAGGATGGASTGGASTGGASTGGASTGGAATGGGGATGGAGGTTSSTATLAEDCLDGVDNDGDGDIDCADAECVPGFECVPVAPSGWMGPFLVTRTDYPAAPPACDGGDAPAVFYAGPAGPAECSACSCGDLAGASCSVPGLTCWAGSSSCNGTATDWTPTLADGQCKKPNNLLGFNANLSCSVTSPSQVLEKGSCPPSSVDFPNKDTWANEVGACKLDVGAGCGNGQACVPKAPAGDGNANCIQKTGDTVCPAGAYSQKGLVYTGGTDSRSCTDCACGDSATACNGGGYTFYDADQCGNGGDPPAPIGQNCQNVSPLLDFGSWSVKANLPAPSGACQPSGGEPQGQVNTDGPVTFCCHP